MPYKAQINAPIYGILLLALCTIVSATTCDLTSFSVADPSADADYQLADPQMTVYQT